MLSEMEKPTMSYDTAFENAANDPWVYLDKAEDVLDAKFGSGYGEFSAKSSHSFTRSLTEASIISNSFVEAYFFDKITSLT